MAKKDKKEKEDKDKNGGKKKVNTKKVDYSKIKYTLEEEDERDEAIRKIQGKFRQKIARDNLKRLIKENYVKLYDRINDIYVYKNKQTGEISQEKLVFLGNDDLPDPIDYACPPDYDPIEPNDDGYAIICTVNKFQHDRIPKISGVTNSDHATLCELFGHTLICKLRPENITSILNPTLSDFTVALDRVRRVSKKKTFLVIYICTHVITAKGGETDEESKNEDCYFAFTNTIWGKPKEIAKTAMSVTKFTDILSKILCARKTLFINCAHVPKPEPTFFGSSKSLYPPSNFFIRLATLGKAAVVGNCSIGTSFKDLTYNTPCIKRIMEEEAVKLEEILEAKRNNTYDIDFIDNESLDSSHAGSLSPSLTNTPAVSMKIDSMKSFLTGPKSIEVVKKYQLPTILPVRDPNEIQEIWNNYLIDFNIKPDAAIYVSPQPIFPTIEWVNKENEETGLKEYEVMIPTDEDYADYAKKLQWWALKRTFGPPVNYLKLQFRKQKKKILKSPAQTGIFADSYSLFAKSLIGAMRGGACIPDKEYVTVADIFFHLSNGIQSFINLLKEKDALVKEKEKKIIRDRELAKKMEKQREREAQMKKSDEEVGDGVLSIENGSKDNSKSVSKAGSLDSSPVGSSKISPGISSKNGGELNMPDDDEEEGSSEISTKVRKLDKKKKVLPKVEIKVEEVKLNRSMNPVLVTPYGIDYFVNNTVCFRCGPPPQPDRPYVVRVDLNSIQIEWYMPPFDGIAPSRYEIYMKNVSRTYSDWRPINYSGIINYNKFLIRDLPSGVPCQFRVRAYNNGGWGAQSEPTLLTTPGEQFVPMSSKMRWKRLNMGGVLMILDRLRLYPYHRLEYVKGLSMLSSYGSKTVGYKKAIQMQIAMIAVHALKTFPNDRQIAGTCFTLLGWSLMGENQRKVKHYMMQNNVGDLTIQYMAKFRCDSIIINAIAHLRSCMAQPPILGSKWIPVPDPIVVPDHEKSDDDESTDDEEEESSKSMEAKDNKKNEKNFTKDTKK